MNARKVCLYSLLLPALLLLCVPAHSIIYVSKSGADGNDGLTWATSKLTIQAGVTTAAASADHTVWVAVGTLPPPVFPLQPTAVPYVENVVVPASVAVYGGFRGDEAASAPPPVRVLSTVVHPAVLVTSIFTAGSGDIIDGFTIENGGPANGAGILCSGTACTISNDIIRNNIGQFGAGVYTTTAALAVTNCQFSGNEVGDISGTLAAGASIYATGSSLVVSGSRFTNESASVTVADGNSAQGGAIYSAGATLVRLDRCVFDDCVADGTQQTVFASGGAVYITGALSTITNCVFHACAAKGSGDPKPAFGGAIYYHNLGSISIINNTFVANAVTPQAGSIADTDRPYGLGGAIYLTGAGSIATIVNNIITQTRGTAVVSDNMTVKFNCNLLWHNAGGDIYGFLFPVQNPPGSTDSNIMKDPQFRLDDPLFHITFGSPAKDAGQTAGAPPLDIDGETRPFNVIVDIGADEFVDTDHDGGADVDPAEVSPGAILLPETDLDLDQVYTPYDNCPAIANPAQIDSNGDGIGDVCEGIPEVFYVNAAAAPGGDGLSWGTAFKTIQEGINAADLHNQTSVDGATPWAGVNPQVWVKAGVYDERPLVWHGVHVFGGFSGTELPPSVNPNVLSSRLPLVNVSQINGGGVWSTVVIAHLPQDRYLAGATKTAYDALSPTVDGFLIRNGEAEIGGGVSVYKETANVSANRIESNAARLGGGVYLFKSSGIVGDGIGPAPGNLLTGDTTINRNIALGPDGYGGGIYTEQGAPLIFGNIIEGNSAHYGGGAASRKSNPAFVENLIGCQMSPNTASLPGGSGKGGGVYLDKHSWAGFEKNTIVSNQAQGPAGQGGGIWFDTSDFYMNLTIMAFNTAVAGQEIWGNSPTAQVVLYPRCFITLSDFWPAVASEFFGIPDPTLNGLPTDPCPTTTNFAVNPLFVDPATCNYRLQAGSPLRLPSGEMVGAFQDVDPPVSIADAKKLANGITVEISGAVVSAVFPDGFYIQDEARINGIKVMVQDAKVYEGQIVDVTGVMTTLNDERQLINATVSSLLGAAMSLSPIGMPNRTVGGGPVGEWTGGVDNGAGLSNVGLLVRTWGRVTKTGASPYPYFTIDDGSRVGVTVRVPLSGSLPAVGSVVTVTGISTIDMAASGDRGRMIRARRASDITPR